MEVLEIDTERIRQSVNKLKKLKKRCEATKSERIIIDKGGAGNTYNELIEACSVVKENLSALIELIDKTIAYMEQFANAYESSDKISAARLQQVTLYDTLADKNHADNIHKN